MADRGRGAPERAARGRVRRSALTSRGPIRSVALVAAVVAVMVVSVPTLAGAIGNSDLDSIIISTPEPGWVLSPAQESSQLSSINRVIASAQAGSGAAGAVKVWQPPDAGGQLFVDELFNFPNGIPDPGIFSAKYVCTRSNGTSVVTHTVTSVPHASGATCVLSTNTDATVLEAEKGTHVILMFGEAPAGGQTPLTLARVTTLLSNQYNNLPGGSSLGGTILVIIGIIAVVIAIGVVFMSRRRRAPVPRYASSAPASSRPRVVASRQRLATTDDYGLSGSSFRETAEPAATASVRTAAREELHVEPVVPDEPDQPEEVEELEPGWYPNNDEQTDLSYWDGQAFISRRRWDGSEWQEV